MYKLVQRSINPVVAKFQVVNRAGEIIGSINVPPEEANALLKHWGGPVERPAARMSVPAFQLGKPRPMSRAAILRGCL